MEKYEVNAYLGLNFVGLMDSLKTNDFSKVQDFIHENCMNGNQVEIWNTETGKRYRINVDEYCDNFNGEGWMEE